MFLDIMLAVPLVHTLAKASVIYDTANTPGTLDNIIINRDAINNYLKYTLHYYTQSRNNR